MKTQIIAGLLMACVVGEVSADEPSYQDTVTFIQGIVDGKFSEVGKCAFNFEYGAWSESYNASDLTANANNEQFVSFNCSDARDCVRFKNPSRRLVELHGYTRLHASENTKNNKVGKAMTHLIELCGGRSFKKDLF